MRILHCSDSFWPRTSGIGGIQIWLTHLARQQVGEGHAVAVITWALPGHAEQATWGGLEVFRLPVSEEDAIRSPDKMREAFLASERIKQSFAADVLHLHPNQLAFWIAAIGSHPPRTVVTAHIPVDRHGPREKMHRRVLEDADVLAVPTEDLRNSYAQSYPELVPKLQIIPHGLENPIEPDVVPPSDRFTFICLGRLVPEKGFDIAIRALAAVKRGDFRLVIVGEGPGLLELRDLARNLHVESQVEMRGWIHPDDVPTCLKSAHVLIVPSVWREPFGLVALEAGQMGLPVIASNVGGLPEIVRDGENGRLVPSGDVGGLARAMLELADNPLLCETMGRQGRKHSREKFTIEACSRAYHAAYSTPA
jgi:glycogen(starch) synthase